jgi:hypothetical protein
MYGLLLIIYTCSAKAHGKETTNKRWKKRQQWDNGLPEEYGTK